MPIGKSQMSPDSTIETFIACKLNVDNWRWAGAPFYLRTGKYMKQRKTEIAIRFHQAPYSLFRGTDVGRLHPNWMILRIQPDEGIALEFAAKRRGQTVTLGNVKFDFAYNDYFKAAPNTGYETLIYDCLICSNIRLGWGARQRQWSAPRHPCAPCVGPRRMGGLLRIRPQQEAGPVAGGAGRDCRPHARPARWHGLDHRQDQ